MFTNIGFYMAWAAIALIPLAIAIIAPETAQNKILASILVLVITFGLTWGMYNECSSADDRWNNGVHAECGGAYQFSGATHYRISTSYYYTCDKCGHTEEFPMIMK